MSSDATTIACCDCCGGALHPHVQPDAVPSAPSPVPAPPATAPTPPRVGEAPGAVAPPTTPVPPQPANASWPVRVPLADGSWVWMTVPYTVPTLATDTSDAGPTTQPIGHDATRPPVAG